MAERKAGYDAARRKQGMVYENAVESKRLASQLRSASPSWSRVAEADERSRSRSQSPGGRVYGKL